jgi:uncharacterized protein (DUF1697 family)
MVKYAAFLRGINVGGNKIVPMAKLKQAFEKEGFRNVATLLASGNIVFEGEEKKLAGIPSMLEGAFGFPIDTIVVPLESVQKMVKPEPFDGIKITPNIRLYVTFLKEKPATKMKLPYVSQDKSFSILKIESNAIFSVLDVDKKGTVDAMAILETEFGKGITTRNWNTVQKVAAMGSTTHA